VAVVKVNYVPNNNRAKAKDFIKYMEQRAGRDGAKITRTLFGTGGVLQRLDCYNLIDEAERGTRYFRVVINPDVKTEDTKRDLNMAELVETTISKMREEMNIPLEWVAAIHTDHTPQRHIHAFVIAKTRLLPAVAMRETATQICREQRQERDLIYEKAREMEQERGGEGRIWERERSR
jgi:hypothetical protein